MYTCEMVQFREVFVILSAHFDDDFDLWVFSGARLFKQFSSCRTTALFHFHKTVSEEPPIYRRPVRFIEVVIIRVICSSTLVVVIF